jgi:hypothetical protein
VTWYATGGQQLIFVMLGTILSPHIAPLMRYRSGMAKMVSINESTWSIARASEASAKKVLLLGPGQARVTRAQIKVPSFVLRPRGGWFAPPPPPAAVPASANKCTELRALSSGRVVRLPPPPPAGRGPAGGGPRGRERKWERGSSICEGGSSAICAGGAGCSSGIAWPSTGIASAGIASAGIANLIRARGVHGVGGG